MTTNKQTNNFLILESLFTILFVTCSNFESDCVVSGTTVDAIHVLQNIFTKMETNYQNVSLDAIASEFGYSKSYICILFKKHYNSTFYTKLNEIKLLHAKKMLLDTNFPIADIANTLGFESVEYFHRLFKKNCGITPNNYRNSNRKNN